MLSSTIKPRSKALLSLPQPPSLPTKPTSSLITPTQHHIFSTTSALAKDRAPHKKAFKPAILSKKIMPSPFMYNKTIKEGQKKELDVRKRYEEYYAWTKIGGWFSELTKEQRRVGLGWCGVVVVGLVGVNFLFL